MTIDKQSSEVRRILTHLKGLNACDIDEILEKVNAISRSQQGDLA